MFLWQKEMGTSTIPKTIDGKNMKANAEVAKVGDHPIMYDEWMSHLQETHGKAELKEMVNKELVHQAADERGITIDEKVIERDIALLATMQHGLSEDEIDREKERWERQIIYRYTLEALLTENLSIDEDEIKTYYDTYENQYNFSESVQMSHIIVQTMEEAERVKEQLDEGAPFELLAQEYSLDEETKNKGGYLGHISSASQFMPRGYVEKALELEHFSYSEPFQTDVGVAIIYLYEHYPSYTFTYEELKPYIERELLLKDSQEQLEATDLWELYDVEWLYD